MKRDQGMFMQL